MGCSRLGAGCPRSVLWGCPGGLGQAASAFCTVWCSRLPGLWVFKRRWGIGLKDGGKPGLKTGGFIIAIHLWSFIAEKLSPPIQFHFLCVYWSSSCRVRVCDVLMCWGPNECERCLICLLVGWDCWFFFFFPFSFSFRTRFRNSKMLSSLFKTSPVTNWSCLCSVTGVTWLGSALFHGSRRYSLHYSLLMLPTNWPHRPGEERKIAGVVSSSPNNVFLFGQVANNEVKLLEGRLWGTERCCSLSAPATNAVGRDCWRPGVASKDGYLFPFCVSPYLCECLSVFRVWSMRCFSAVTVLFDSWLNTAE